MVLFVSLFDRGVIKCQVSNRIHRIGCALFVIILCLSSSASSHIFNSSSGNSTYVERCRADCAVHKDLISCGKFRVVRWLNDIAREKVGSQIGTQIFYSIRNNRVALNKRLLKKKKKKRREEFSEEISCTSSGWKKSCVRSLFIIRKRSNLFHKIPLFSCKINDSWSWHYASRFRYYKPLL